MALLFVSTAFVIATLLGLLARSGKKMDLEQWTIGGRGFGSALVFLLMAGEIYTTFTFLGASGYIYKHGASALYILAYGALAYILGYWILPPIWRYAKEHELITQADFFAHRFQSRSLGVAVGFLGILAMLPYLALQLKGLGLIVEVTTGGAINQTSAVLIGAAALIVYVSASGIHASAWTAVLKDIAVLAVVIFLGIYLPQHAFGGIGPMFTDLLKSKPQFFVLQSPQNSVWFISTILVSALGFWMWPHAFAYTFAARDEQSFKRNAVLLPLYQLILVFVFFVGLAAIRIVPHLKQSDLALLAATASSLPAWALGIVGGSGVLAALVPGSLLVIVISTLLSKNGLALFPRFSSERQITLAAKAFVVPVTAIAAAFAIVGNSSIVGLLLLGYSYITQLFPALILAFVLPRNLTCKHGAFWGIATGTLVVTILTVTHDRIIDLIPFLPKQLADLNNGIAALGCNFLIVITAYMVSIVNLTARRSGS